MSRKQGRERLKVICPPYIDFMPELSKALLQTHATTTARPGPRRHLASWGIFSVSGASTSSRVIGHHYNFLHHQRVSSLRPAAGIRMTSDPSYTSEPIQFIGSSSSADDITGTPDMKRANTVHAQAGPHGLRLQPSHHSSLGVEDATPRYSTPAGNKTISKTTPSHFCQRMPKRKISTGKKA
ncbi:uncharacterized protein LOC125046104 [Penaeus chinensis]|uniref:uncharacterized protein LOC125046102 n=1 Tax=Penaeus chinensis TaxID=139456 RepID=UPI001FB5A5C2|nr:uncharacterized protein LOC125046102 [Penaeus chinensis]XP_047499697.1 uncharacterized protein LOC125046104 [Penaeus chinensis]